MKNKFKYILALLMVLISPPLYAYIGPGTGAGVITAVLGILASILIAIFGIIYYPIKRWLKNRKTKKN